MKELLQIGLLIGGWSLVTLCLASFWIPKALGWREKLAGLPPLMRELWWTYAAYVLGSLPTDCEILVHCKAGGRSAKAVQLLLSHGFTRVKNVAGGMDAWLAEN